MISILYFYSLFLHKWISSFLFSIYFSPSHIWLTSCFFSTLIQDDHTTKLIATHHSLFLQDFFNCYQSTYLLDFKHYLPHNFWNGLIIYINLFFCASTAACTRFLKIFFSLHFSTFMDLIWLCCDLIFIYTKLCMPLYIYSELGLFFFLFFF